MTLPADIIAALALPDFFHAYRNEVLEEMTA